MFINNMIIISYHNEIIINYFWITFFSDLSYNMYTYVLDADIFGEAQLIII